MQVRCHDYGSPGYEACLELRRRVLREPLGLDWSEADLVGEEEQRHFGLHEGGTLVACLVICPPEHGIVKLRQMAVEVAWQGRGVGRKLLDDVMDLLREEGVREVELHAREAAAGFYERLGFEREGDRFLEVGIPHWKMMRKVEPRSGRPLRGNPLLT